MKKSLSIIAIAIMSAGLVSCKKETTTEVTSAEDSLAVESTDKTAGMDARLDSLAQVSTTAETTTPAPAGPTTTVALSENSFDFGKVTKGKKVEHVFELTNTGTNPLIISEVKPACGCTAPDYTKDPIMPGKKGKVTLSFDSSNFNGPQSKYADVFVNVDNSPIRLSFTADVQP